MAICVYSNETLFFNNVISWIMWFRLTWLLCGVLDKVQVKSLHSVSKAFFLGTSPNQEEHVQPLQCVVPVGIQGFHLHT